VIGDAVATVIGSGDVSLGRSASRGVDDRAVARAVQLAIESGVTIVDCADEADAERVVGDAVRVLRARDRVVVSTRVPAVGSALTTVRAVQACVEATLRATRLDALPLALISVKAWWRTDAAWAELVETCARLVHDGKVMRWGACVAAEDLRGDDAAALAAPWLAEASWLAALRVDLSLCARDALALIDALAAIDRAAGEAPRAPGSTAGKLALLIARPLAGGTLAGTIGAGAQLRPRDDRRALDDRELARVARGVATLSAFARAVPLAADPKTLSGVTRVEPIECADVAELALRWAIDRSGGIALPRLSSGDHVIAALAAAIAPPLPGDLMMRLEELDI
jgi:aryl-alcohol dehydrogenase-like predicted oxidoreductase